MLHLFIKQVTIENKRSHHHHIGLPHCDLFIADCINGIYRTEKVGKH